VSENLFALSVLAAYALGLMASWGLEAAWLRPRPTAPWRRPLPALGVHAGVWTLAFALALAFFRRPYFAAANALALQAVFILVNNAKHQALREPFVYPDCIFFTDALKHPRLYLPFLGWLPPLAAALGYGLALWAALAREPSAAPGVPTAVFLAHTAVWAACGLLAARLAASRLPLSPRFDAAGDLQQLGLVAALWQYARAERADTRALRAAAPFAALAMPITRRGPQSAPLPDLIVIQSESFFDPRRFYPKIRPEVLAHYDALCTQALQHGLLQVDAWGANTVRTEFAFLSGLPPEALGVHRFHPYRKLAAQGLATLASHVRSLGYRCVCVHPYHGSFYGRDKILPRLGFDAFIDIRAFRAARRAGTYVGDLALLEQMQALLEPEDRPPLYLHAITMENHGPLHWERVRAADAQTVLSSPMPPGCDDLAAYLLHLRNADAMFGRLRQFLSGRARPSVLCILGDHVPIMPKVYQQWGAPDGATNYLVWHTHVRPASRQSPVTLAAHQLGQVFLAQAGLY